jgi:hypothetical protein
VGAGPARRPGGVGLRRGRGHALILNPVVIVGLVQRGRLPRGIAVLAVYSGSPLAREPALDLRRHLVPEAWEPAGPSG